jgi:hypothetical protein
MRSEPQTETERRGIGKQPTGNQSSDPGKAARRKAGSQGLVAGPGVTPQRSLSPSLLSAAGKASSAARRFVPLASAFSQPRPIRRDRTTRLGSLRASFLPGRFLVSGAEAAVAARCSYVGDSVLFFPPGGRIAIIRTEARWRRNRGGHTTDRSYRRRTDWS